MPNQVHKPIDLGNDCRIDLDSYDEDDRVTLSLSDSTGATAFVTVTPLKAKEIYAALGDVIAGATSP